MNTILRCTSVFLLDLDGTVYLDGTPIGEMPAALRRLRGMGKRLVFLTNNSSRTQTEYRQKLTRMGLFEGGDLVYTSAMATVSYLKERYAGAKVYLVATDAVREEFSRDVTLSEDDPDVCVLAYDTTLTFEKIKKLDFFLKKGKPFLATHPDDVCPTAYGSMPDVGSFLAMFERSSGRNAVIVGKPFPYMGEALCRLTGAKRREICMVGDRMHTDVRFANNCGFRSVLVLSGETTSESMGKFPDKPDLVLESFDRILIDNLPSV